MHIDKILTLIMFNSIITMTTSCQSNNKYKITNPIHNTPPSKNVSDATIRQFKKNIVGKYKPNALASIDFGSDFMVFTYGTIIDIKIDSNRNIKLTIINPSTNQDLGNIIKIIITETNAPQNIEIIDKNKSLLSSVFLFTKDKRVLSHNMTISIENNILYLDNKKIGVKIKKNMEIDPWLYS